VILNRPQPKGFIIGADALPASACRRNRVARGRTPHATYLRGVTARANALNMRLFTMKNNSAMGLIGVADHAPAWPAAPA